MLVFQQISSCEANNYLSVDSLSLNLKNQFYSGLEQLWS